MTQGSSAEHPVQEAQPHAENNTDIVHTKEDLMNLYPDCFTGLGKFQGEPSQIKLDPHVSPKRTPC